MSSVDNSSSSSSDFSNLFPSIPLSSFLTTVNSSATPNNNLSSDLHNTLSDLAGSGLDQYDIEMEVLQQLANSNSNKAHHTNYYQIYLEASNPINSKKNRYFNVLPAHHSRVILNSTSSSVDAHCDYINANYIKSKLVGCEKNNYIAAQAPLPNTFNDWWKMIWSINIHETYYTLLASVLLMFVCDCVFAVVWL
jgi:hypothetical protein